VYRGLDSCVPDHDASTGLTTYYYETFTVAPPALSGKSKGGVKPLSKGGVAGVVVAVLLVFIGSCAGLWYYCVKVLPPDEEEEPKKKGHEGKHVRGHEGKHEGGEDGGISLNPLRSHKGGHAHGEMGEDKQGEGGEEGEGEREEGEEPIVGADPSYDHYPEHPHERDPPSLGQGSDRVTASLRSSISLRRASVTPNVVDSESVLDQPQPTRL
jgi:hypothetical protein